ncbi:MAG: DegV family protein [Christensenellaceae bacterium]
MIRITSDSTCDLTKEILEAEQVILLPLNVILGSETRTDGVDIVPSDIFRFVEQTNQLPKTAARSIEEYEEFFHTFVDVGETVIHFNISSKASSSNAFAMEAAERAGLKGKVFVIDSKALSSGQGLLIMKACDLRREGKSAEEIVDTVNALRPKVNTSFIPDTLDYLYKGGRCSKMSFYGAKILNIHPMIAMEDGQLVPAKKYVGSMNRCMRFYSQDLKEKYPNYDRTRCFITHSSADRELVDLAKARVQELFDFEEVIESVAGSVITGHCGRNTIGILFISE